MSSIHRTAQTISEEAVINSLPRKQDLSSTCFAVSMELIALRRYKQVVVRNGPLKVPRRMQCERWIRRVVHKTRARPGSDRFQCTRKQPPPLIHPHDIDRSGLTRG